MEFLIVCTIGLITIWYCLTKLPKKLSKCSGCGKDKSCAVHDIPPNEQTVNFYKKKLGIIKNKGYICNI